MHVHEHEHVPCLKSTCATARIFKKSHRSKLKHKTFAELHKI